MKKIDKLILKAFVGPFILTFAVVTFIFLTQTIIKYFDDFVGKGLSLVLFAELLFYFALNTTPVTLPLAVLLSSLMTYGNLGEHFELTAIKSAGISLTRVLLPLFFFSILLSFAAFWFNNTVVPKANLNAFSLLWDIRQKKPTLSIKEGVFYKDLPGVAIKANKKLPDEKTMLDVMIYDHSDGNGNTRVILADTARMFTILYDRYLVFDLFHGESYDDYSSNPQQAPNKNQFVRNKFSRYKMVFNLSSFDMQKTDKDLFKSHRMMKNITQLNEVADSLQKQYQGVQKTLTSSIKQYYFYQQGNQKGEVKAGKWVDSVKNVKYTPYQTRDMLSRAANQARNIRSTTESKVQETEALLKERRTFVVEKYKKYTQSVACLVMFLIGAPLGAIIKKGGLGMPVLISILFFIIFYVFSLLGEKWSKEGLVLIPYGVWGADFILFWIGMFFLRQARHDSRLLEADAYRVAFNRLKDRLRKRRKPVAVPAGV